MPITLFHLGPGAAVKAAAPASVSFTVFAFAQFLIDLEPVSLFLLTGDPAHPYLHTFLGATLVALASWWPGRRICESALRVWNAWLSPAQARWLACEPRIPGRAAAAGAFLGAYSHVAIDSIMHADMRPFAPFSDARPWVGAMPIETLQWICVAAGLAGLVVLFALRWRELRRRASIEG